MHEGSSTNNFLLYLHYSNIILYLIIKECFNTSNNYGSVIFDDSIDIERLASIEKHLTDEIKGI